MSAAGGGGGGGAGGAAGDSASSFSPEYCAAQFDECAAHLQDIPVAPFLTACEEIKKIVGAWRPPAARRCPRRRLPTAGHSVPP